MDQQYGSGEFPANTAVGVDWASLVEAVQNDQPSGMEELYRVFVRGVRYFLCRQLGPQELEDRVHDTFIIVVQAIKRGEIREPDRLMGFVRTIVRRQVATYIDVAVQLRRDQADFDAGIAVPDSAGTPEQQAITEERVEVMRQVLASMSPRDREVLTRFYIDEQPQEQICEEMNLSDTQFRLLKSRAKARFGEIGRRSIQKKGVIQSFWLRTIASVHH